jgi:hypothetical protein
MAAVNHVSTVTHDLEVPEATTGALPDIDTMVGPGASTSS